MLGVLVLLPVNGEYPSMLTEYSEEGKGNGVCLFSHKLLTVCVFEALSVVLMSSDYTSLLALQCNDHHVRVV